MSHPIIQRELMGTLRTWRAFAMLLGAAVIFAFLVVSRWPSNSTVELSGVQAQEVFRVFAYGLLFVMLLLVPAVPATSIVREKMQGTLTLLLNSPLSATSIFLGKLTGVFLFVGLLLLMSLPAAAAAFAMGGISLSSHLLPLYGILLLILLEYTTLSLMISSYANSIDASLRVTYAVVLLLAVGTLGPHYLLQGEESVYTLLARYLVHLSPIPPIMELVGHGDVGRFDLMSVDKALPRFVMVSLSLSLVFCILTVAQLRSHLLDRPRSQGIVTDQRSTGQRWLRRMVFLVDPQRRKKGISFFMNPVMVKEFRTRRFGRSHWLLRLISAAALFSLYLAYASASTSVDLGPETIAGTLVVLQVALLIMITPSLAANLISAERETGGWDLLMMTPLSAVRIVIGKLLSVFLTLILVLLATLPGYLALIFIYPPVRWRVWQVMICMGWTLVFAVTLSAAVSSLCRRAATATTIAYALLGAVCVGTMLFWLGRDTTFGHDIVEQALTINPTAAALNIMEVTGFTGYNLVPANWWWMGVLSSISTLILLVQTWRLTRPQ